jgi:hypothetical protein
VRHPGGLKARGYRTLIIDDEGRKPSSVTAALEGISKRAEVRSGSRMRGWSSTLICTSDLRQAGAARSLEAIRADILALQKETEGLLGRIGGASAG